MSKIGGNNEVKCPVTGEPCSPTCKNYPFLSSLDSAISRRQIKSGARKEIMRDPVQGVRIRENCERQPL